MKHLLGLMAILLLLGAGCTQNTKNSEHKKTYVNAALACLNEHVGRKKQSEQANIDATCQCAFDPEAQATIKGLEKFPEYLAQLNKEEIADAREDYYKITGVDSSNCE